MTLQKRLHMTGVLLSFVLKLTANTAESYWHVRYF